MDILLLTQVLPHPPDSGPKVKTWNVIKYLARQHAVTLVSFTRGESEAALAPLRAHCRAVHTVPMARGTHRDAWFLLRSLVSGRPFLMQRDDRAAMRRMVDQVGAAQRFDAVHADQLNMAQYALRVPARQHVLDAHNALYVVYRRLARTRPAGPVGWLMEREWHKLRRYEAECGKHFDTVLAVSEADRTALRRAMGDAADIRVVPIAIDLDEVPLVARRPEARRILHVGTMHWPPNADAVRWFADAVLPIIRAARPDTAFDVVGARPPRAVRRLGQDGVNVTGYVADPTPYLEQAGVMVVPLRAAGGIRVKILHALAQGIPVVSTTIGCEGLAVEHEREVLIADAPEDFARAVLRVLAEPDLVERLCRNGRALIESTYDLRIACRPLDALYPAGGGDRR